MPLPPLERLDPGAPLPQWRAVLPAKAEVYFKFLLIAHMKLTSALANLEPAEGSAYPARRRRLVANLKTVEDRLSTALDYGHQAWLNRLLE